MFGSRSVSVKVYPRGPVWKRHIDQLRVRYPDPIHDDTEEETSSHIESSESTNKERGNEHQLRRETEEQVKPESTPEYGRGNPRRSTRVRKKTVLFNL